MSEEREERQHRYPNLRETLKPLVEDFLSSEDPLTTWSTMPEHIDLMHARGLIEEAESLGVVLPQRAENFLKCVGAEEYHTRYRAAFILWLVGRRISKIEELDNRRRSGRLIDFVQMANELELGKLDPEELMKE